MSASVSMQHHRGWLWKTATGVGLGALLILLAYAAGVFPRETLASAPVLGAEAAARVAGNTAFALDLFAHVRGSGSNLVFSPYSVSTCLGLTFAGARGNTERQMAKVLHFGSNPSQVHAAFGQLQRQLGATQKGTELDLANGLWAQAGHPFLPAFLDLARQSYDATLKQVDFETAADSAGKDINAWVGDRTKGKLRNTIPRGLLNGNTDLVLVNVIYFKGTWETKFNPSETSEQPFHLDSSRTVKCQMMHCTGKFRSGRNYPDCDVIELPYGGNAFSMFVLLPMEWEGLPRLESKFTAQNLSSWLASVQEPREAADVFLPKFKFQTEFNLNQALAGMGMADAFCDKADFSGIDGTTNLYVSDVLHQAFVEVDEEGTQAGAATISHVNTLGMSPRFRADHPFLFLIRDNRSGSILFLGRVADPSRT